MTAAGWIFMLVSWGVIIGLFGFCLVRTLRTDSQKHSDAEGDSRGR